MYMPTRNLNDLFPAYGCIYKRRSLFSGRDMWGRTETWYIINKQGRVIKLNTKIIDSAPFNKDGYALIIKTVNDWYSKCTYIDRQGREVFVYGYC